MADAKVTSVILLVGREQTDESLGPGVAVSQTTKVGLIEVSGTPAQVTQVAAGAAIEAECDARITHASIAPAVEAVPFCRVTQVTLAVIYKPLPACLGVTAAINSETLVITGTAIGSYATKWQVVRLGDGEIMDSGLGETASFSFQGAYGASYQVQFGA